MGLITGALLSVAELMHHLKIGESDILTPFFKIYNSSADATAGTIQVTGNKIYLVVTGGANASSTNFVFTNALYDTISELVVAINTYAHGWVANVDYGSGDRSSTDLWNVGTTSCLLIANEVEVLGKDYLYYETKINEATRQIERFCRRDGFLVTAADETRYYDLNFNRVLFLDKYPIVSITSIYLWDTTTNPESVDDLLVAGTDYVAKMNEGMIFRWSNWGSGFKQVRIIGKFGYASADMPDDLKLACKELCAYNISNGDRAGLKSENIGTYSYSKNDNADGMPIEIAEKLSPYVNRGSNIG